MRIRLWVRGTMFITVSLLLTSLLFADEFPIPKVDFSADMLMDTGIGPEGQSMVMEGKIFSSQKYGERREMSQEGHRSIMITRREKGQALVLMPENKTYLEIPEGESEGRPGLG